MSLCCCGNYEETSSGNEVVDDDAVNLSHVGEAAYNCLRRKHNWHHHKLWNVTSGVVIGEVDQTPHSDYSWRSTDDPPENHDDWFPKKLSEIISRTEIWCDVMSLGPPDGMFMTEFNQALKNIANKYAEQNGDANKKPVIIRLMFGNIVGMPVNCTAVIRKLVEGVPRNGSIHLWVGAWRKGVSWNHAKIIAVDGQYLHTGGHNLWYQHYCIHNPVHDLSFELAGRCAHDGHLYANEQWKFIELMQSTCCGQCIDKMPDGLPLVATTRVTVSEFPEAQAMEFPPYYSKKLVPMRDRLENEVPLITMGRYGTLVPFKRPSDDAFLAMLDAAKTIIRMALQDLGPVCIPGTKITLPGCVWPKAYLSALGRAIWTKGVDVEIALSNPGSIPGGLAATEACYGNGWSCVDVAAEIIKTIRVQFPEADDAHLREKVSNNLRVCFIRHKNGNAWKDGTTMGMHAKHFIVDDVCYYIGSQNFYICDLAEWGVCVDDEAQTKKVMEEYWTPMWEASFTGEDCNTHDVMDGLDIDRSAEQNKFVFGADKRQQRMAMAKAQTPQRTLAVDPDLFYDEKEAL